MALTVFYYLILVLATSNIHESHAKFSRSNVTRFHSYTDVGLPDFTVALLDADYRFKCPGVIITPRAILTMDICYFDAQLKFSPPVYVIGRKMVHAATQKMENWIHSLVSLNAKFKSITDHMKQKDFKNHTKRIEAAFKYPAAIVVPEKFPFYDDTKKVSVIVEFNKSKQLYKAFWNGHSLLENSVALPLSPEHSDMKSVSQSHSSDGEGGFQNGHSESSNEGASSNVGDIANQEQISNMGGSSENSNSGLDITEGSSQTSYEDRSVRHSNTESTRNSHSSDGRSSSESANRAGVLDETAGVSSGVGEINRAKEVTTIHGRPLKDFYRGNHAFHVGGLSNTEQNQDLDKYKAEHDFVKVNIPLSCSIYRRRLQKRSESSDRDAWMTWKLELVPKNLIRLTNVTPLDLSESLAYLQKGLTKGCQNSNSESEANPQIYNPIGTPYFVLDEGKIFLSSMLSGKMVEHKEKESNEVVKYLEVIRLNSFNEWIKFMLK